MAQAWPLVGREGELEQAVDALDDPEVRGVLIIGDAGVGKTRLADEAISRVADRGHVSVWVSASAATRTIPLGAFASVISISEDRLPGLLQRAADALAELGGEQGLVVAIDDAHQLDDASTALVNMLTTRASFRFVMTARADELGPSPVFDLWKEGRVHRLDLAPLDREATAHLVRTVLGSGVQSRVIERLWQLSRGNTLFLREIVMAAVERRERGVGGPVALADTSLGRLRDLIGARIDFLDEPARSALEVVAVGEALPLHAAESLIDQGILEFLEGRGLVEVRAGPAGGALRTAHPLYGEVLRRSIPTLRRRSVLRSLADAVVGSVDPNDLLRGATWRLDSGDEGDPEALLRAARTALARLDGGLAERLARAAHDAGIADAAFVLGESLRVQGRNPEAEALLTAIDAAQIEERTKAAVTRASNLFWGMHETEAALDVLREAERDAAADPFWLAECRSQLSQLLLFCARFDEGASLAERVLSAAEASEAARLRSAPAAAISAVIRAQFDEGQRVLDSWMPAAVASQEVPLVDLQLRLVQQLLYFWSGRLADAKSYAEGRFGLDVDDPPAPLASLLAGARGLVLVSEGRAIEAREAMSAAVELSREGDWFGVRPALLAYLARAELLCGDVKRARTHIAEAETVFGSSSARTATFRSEIDHADAWARAADGELAEAAEFTTAIADRELSAFAVVSVHALHLLGRIGRADLALPRLEALVEQVDGPAVGLFRDHVAALHKRDSAALEAAASRLAETGYLLAAAEAWRSAAVVHHGDGKGAAALAAERRARALLDECGHPQSPGLELEPFTGAGELTDREREVAVLAAKGLSSPDIASRLELSVRTVDTHLARVYRKLSVKGRHELSDALGLDGG